MNKLIIRDENTAGKILSEISLQFEKEYITVEELIAARIAEEVKRYESDITSYSKGLVVPSDIENRLNNRKKPQIDVEKQVYIACQAFNDNAYFILIDDEQVDELDQKFLVDESAKVSFIKLTPLVGG